eukprot:2676069-Amphidinium_carterae.1
MCSTTSTVRIKAMSLVLATDERFDVFKVVATPRVCLPYFLFRGTLLMEMARRTRLLSNVNVPLERG